MSVNSIPPNFVDRLDQDFLDFHEANFSFRPAWMEPDLADMRKHPRKYALPWSQDYTFLPFVKDIQIPTSDGQEITARCYHPDPRTSPFGEGPYPVHVSYHGMPSFLSFCRFSSIHDPKLIRKNRWWICIW